MTHATADKKRNQIKATATAKVQAHPIIERIALSTSSTRNVSESSTASSYDSQSSHESGTTQHSAISRLSSMLANANIIQDDQCGIINSSVGEIDKFITPLPINNYDNNKNKANSNRKQSTSSNESLSSNGSSTSSILSDEIEINNNNEEIKDIVNSEAISQCKSLKISFKCSLSEEKEVEWNTILANDVLYVDIPASLLPEGSRDSFVSLLEFAEDKLECQRVYVCFKRDRPDRTALMRVFMFLGFCVMPPMSTEIAQSEDIMSMVYHIE